MHSRENLKDLEEPTANLNHHLTMKAIAAMGANHLTIYLANLVTIVIQIKHYVHQNSGGVEIIMYIPKFFSLAINLLKNHYAVLGNIAIYFWDLTVGSVLSLSSHIGVLLRISIA